MSKLEIIDEKKLYEKHGIHAHQVCDYKVLKGDASDNIMGVSGIGEKTAVKLLEKFNNLDNIINNLSFLPEKLRLKFNDLNHLLLIKRVIEINKNVPIDFNLN